jgi:hypothetical protein
MNLHQKLYSLSHNPAVGVMPFVNEITTTLKEFEDNETLQPSFSTSIDSAVKEETLPYAKKTHHHESRGVCLEQGMMILTGVTQRTEMVSVSTVNILADMPMDVKEHILNHHAHCAHIVTEDTLSLALMQLPSNDLLTLALSQDHHAHTTIDSSGWCIFGPDKDVPIKFQTADG